MFLYHCQYGFLKSVGKFYALNTRISQEPFKWFAVLVNRVDSVWYGFSLSRIFKQTIISVVSTLMSYHFM